MTKKKKKLHLKYEVKKVLIYLLVIVLVFIYAIGEANKVHKQVVYEKSYEYKLIKKKYPEEEAKKLSSTLEDDILDKILSEKNYNETYYQIVTQKYYLNKNFNEYVEYQTSHPNSKYEKTIAIVNVKANKNWYTNETKTNLEDGYLMLVNRYNYLEPDYERIDLEPFSLAYSYGSYGSNKAAEIVVDSFDQMQADLKEELGIQIMVTGSYRSYEQQDNSFNIYGYDNATKAGFSEHQTGLAIDIVSVVHPGVNEFYESDEGKWVVENAYKYGFIIRYPLDKEDITEYNNDSLHLRYVGEKVAKQIKDENITFDEYHAYYIVGDK